MKRVYILFLPFLSSLFFASLLCSASAEEELRGVMADVRALQLGFGDYVLARQLSVKQQEVARSNAIAKTIEGTVKFRDGDVYVVAKKDDFTVIGIYRQMEDADRSQVKQLIGELMMKFGEPTTMAHDKILYWAFAKNGKVAEDEYNFSKQTGEARMIATVKFQSSRFITPDTQEESEKKVGAEEKSSVYVVISSNPISSIFLAQDERG